MSKTAHFSEFQRKFNPSQMVRNSYYDDNDIVLFVHIPKTAGMSVGKTLQQAFDDFHPVSWQDIGKSFREKSRLALYQRMLKPRRQILMGHFSWPEVQFWRNQELPIKCASIIRDPVARFLSNYNYNCSERHPNRKQFRKRFPSIEAYAEKLSYDFQLTRLIGEFYSFDHALELICKYYSFIGLTEHLRASLESFSHSHGFDFPLQEHRENVGTSLMPLEEVSSSVRDLVLEKNQNDLRLHELLMSYYA